MLETFWIKLILKIKHLGPSSNPCGAPQVKSKHTEIVSHFHEVPPILSVSFHRAYNYSSYPIVLQLLINIIYSALLSVFFIFMDLIDLFG